MKFKPKILQKMIDNNHKDSFFYEGEIATITKKNGTQLLLIATGDIRIMLNGNCYRNGQVDELDLTDRKLRNLEAKGTLVWENNNWFEVIFKQKGCSQFDCVIGDVVYNYKDAIKLLKGYFDDDTWEAN